MDAMKVAALLIALAVVLLASCVHMDVREEEIDPEGNRPPAEELVSAPYIEPVCDCVYIPVDKKKSHSSRATWYAEQITRSAP